MGSADQHCDILKFVPVAVRIVQGEGSAAGEGALHLDLGCGTGAAQIGASAEELKASVVLGFLSEHHRVGDLYALLGRAESVRPGRFIEGLGTDALVFGVAFEVRIAKGQCRSA